MKDKNVLNDKEFQQVNGGTEVTKASSSARDITSQIVVTTEDDNEVIQGRGWAERMNNNGR